MPPAGHLDVSGLSDKTLTQVLRSYGVDVGPIIAATRRTYERRLIKLQTGVYPPSLHHYQPTNYGDDDYDEDTQVIYPVTKQRPMSFQPKEDSNTIPLWLKLLALGISLTLIYLIYVNMEPPAISNIPEANKVEV